METFIIISIVAIVTFILVYLLLSVGNLEKEVEKLRLSKADLCTVSDYKDLTLKLMKSVAKDVGNLSLTFEDTRHKFEKGWELASKMAADIDNDFISIDEEKTRKEWDEEKTRKEWDEAADKATDRIVKYIADTIANEDIEPEWAEWSIRRYVRTVVGEITK